MARVKILKEVCNKDTESGWALCFQWCEYLYDGEEEDTYEESSQFGYRFIWRRPDNSLQAARGQARIPSIKQMNELLERAAYAGWLGKVETINNKTISL